MLGTIWKIRNLSIMAWERAQKRVVMVKGALGVLRRSK